MILVVNEGDNSLYFLVALIVDFKELFTTSICLLYKNIYNKTNRNGIQYKNYYLLIKTLAIRAPQNVNVGDKIPNSNY